MTATATRTDAPVHSSSPQRIRPSASGFGGTLLVAVAIVFLGQLIRRMFPGVGWYLRDTVGLGPFELIPYAIGPFLLAAAVPIAIRLLRPRGALLVAAVGLATGRVLEQLSTSPQVDLWASMAGVGFGLWVLGLAVTRSRRAVTYGIVLGLAGDTALKGAAGTLELSWAPGLWPTVVVLGLALLMVGLAAATTGVAGSRLESFAWLGLPGGHTPRSGLSFVAIGPLLLMHWLVLHNQGWITTMTGWPWPSALAAILLADVAALLLAGLTLPRSSEGAITALAGLALLAAGATSHLEGWAFALPALFAIALTGPYLATIVAPPDPTRPNGVASGVWLGIGHLGLGVAALGYYLSLELSLPFGQNEIRAGLGAGLAVVGLAAVDIPAIRSRLDTWAVGLAAVLLLVPVGVELGWPEPDATGEAHGQWPLTVMTYNLHGGYGVDGSPTLPHIAEVIEGSGAEVVGLNEIDRGWLLNGSVDVVGWLSRRLDMPYVAFHGTTQDPLWGNAILSKHPFTEVHEGFLPKVGTLIRRGFTLAEIDLAGDEDLTFIVTHLHHEADDLTLVHDVQLDAILEGWDGRPRTVLLGDMNAEPDDPQMQRLIGAGWRDAWADAGEGPGLTWRANDPHKRIDWILYTRGLEARRAETVPTSVSDHRPVVAVIQPAAE